MTHPHAQHDSCICPIFLILCVQVCAGSSAWAPQHFKRVTITHCNILQHTATYCNILQHTATYCNTLQHTASHCHELPRTATHCNTLPQVCAGSSTRAPQHFTASHGTLGRILSRTQELLCICDYGVRSSCRFCVL